MTTVHDIQDFVDKAIEKTNDFYVLNILFDMKLLTSKTLGNESTKIRPTFELHSTVSNYDLVADVLIKALDVCDDCYTYFYAIEYIRRNHENIKCQSSIVKLLNCLICCADLGKVNDPCEYFEVSFLCNILIKSLDNVHIKAKAYEALSQVIKRSSVADQAECFNAIFDSCVQRNNLETFCALLKHLSNDAVCVEISCFNKDNFWLYIESCIAGSKSHLQKQGKFILSKYVHACNNHYGLKYLFNAPASECSWQAFFLLTDIGREKQLHLVEPSLGLFKSIESLPFLWQKCVYKIFLEHSQVSIVFKVAIEILGKNYSEDNLSEIARLVLPAINKNEYSDLSCELFKTLHQFCERLSRNELLVICEEVIQISWNAISFWKVVQNVYIIENKSKMDINLFQEIITCAMNLPHIYIRTECVKYLISVFWNENDYNTIFTIMYAFKQSEQIIDLQYFQKCNISEEVVHSAVNDLLKFNDGCHDFHKTKICFRILANLKVDIWPYIHEQLHSLSPHVMLLAWNHLLSFHSNPEVFYVQVEVFLVKYFKDNLFEGTIGFYIELFKLFAHGRSPSKGTFLHVVDQPIFNLNDHHHNNNQIYVSLSLLQKCIKSGYLDPVIHIKESSDHIIFSLSKKDGPARDIKIEDPRFFNVCFTLFFHIYKNGFVTTDAMKIFTNIMNTQSNEVLHDIYGQLYQLIKVSNSTKFVRECIKISHETLKKLKKDRYFKGIMNGFINAVYSDIYFSLEVDCMDIELINTDLLELSEPYPTIRHEWIKSLWELSRMDLHHDICIKTVVDVYLQGAVVTKDKRNEYNVCQEFISDSEFSIRSYLMEENVLNPNCANAATRMLAVYCLPKRYFLTIINHLIERYRRHSKTRYFPDSEIHYEKLRILQALLILILNQPLFHDDEVETISSFVFDCFEKETNQNCIRQLLNCILIAISKDVSEVLEWIEAKPVSTSPSFFVNVMPTIYHLARDHGSKRTLEKIIKIVLPWTMGSQFKLRVYAQDLIKRIIAQGRTRLYNDFVRKYKNLENAITSCLQSAGDVVAKTMKSDIPFLNDFIPSLHLTEPTIFHDIPRLNRVYHAEWQHLVTPKDLLPDETFANAVDEFLNHPESTTEQTEPEPSHAHHIQKKITPCETALENTGPDVNKDFILVASLIDKAQNLGGLSRTCEVFGIRNIVLHNAKIINDKEFRSLSMSSEGWISPVEVKAQGLREFILKLHDEGYSVIGAEQTAGSRMLTEFKFPRKMALILGNEKTGIPPDIIPLLNVCVEIPQTGQTRSLNVHVAGAMFVWEYAKQHLVLSS